VHLFLPVSTVLYYKKTFIVLNQSHQVRTSLTGRLKVPMNTAEGVEKSDGNRKRGLHHPHGKVIRSGTTKKQWYVWLLYVSKIK
jgi:hypothetical protein